VPPKKLTETEREQKDRNETLRQVAEAFRIWMTAEKNRTKYVPRVPPANCRIEPEKLYESLSKSFHDILADWNDITEWNDEADKWENELDEKLERLAEQKQSYDQLIHILSNFINILERSKTAAIASQLRQTLIDTGVTEKAVQLQQIKAAKEKAKEYENLYKGAMTEVSIFNGQVREAEREKNQMEEEKWKAREDVEMVQTQKEKVDNELKRVKAVLATFRQANVEAIAAFDKVIETAEAGATQAKFALVDKQTRIN
jgi:chromosome segregation ATPase